VQASGLERGVTCLHPNQLRRVIKALSFVTFPSANDLMEALQVRAHVHHALTCKPARQQACIYVYAFKADHALMCPCSRACLEY
jgi:hypothetical protein